MEESKNIMPEKTKESSRELRIERRMYSRSRITNRIAINAGRSPEGGILHDQSQSGVCIHYSDHNYSKQKALKVGQKLVLQYNNKFCTEVKIVRVFRGGFAGEFDFTSSVHDPRFTG